MTNSVFLPISTSLVSRLATHLEICDATYHAMGSKQLNANKVALVKAAHSQSVKDLIDDMITVNRQHVDHEAEAGETYSIQAHKLVNQRAQNLLIRAQRLAAKKIKDQEGRARALELIAA